jgi:hypothetical protein
LVLGAIALLEPTGLEPANALASPACTGAPSAPAAAPTAEALPRPGWLERLIAQLAAQPVGNPPQSVWRYRYRGTLVYYQPPQCCDQYSVLFDAEGRVIAAPDGGLTGRGDGRAADFHAVRTDGQLLWRDPRGPGPQP